jgi:hypothetical protein
VTTPPGPDPGDRPPAGRLDRAPGERYRAHASRTPVSTIADRPPSVLRGVGLAILVALGGALVLAGLGIIDLHAGLLAVGVAVGWGTGLAIRAGTVTEDGVALERRTRSAVAAVVAGAGLATGFLLVWVWSRTEGGALGPLDYLAERFGFWPWPVLALGVLAAALRAR